MIAITGNERTAVAYTPGVHRCILAALALTAGCIEIPPPYTPCLDANDPDFDRDGWRCDAVAFDCDDGDPSINPGALEILSDGIDQDCNQLDLKRRDLPAVSIDTSQGLRAEMEHWTVGFATGGSLLPDSIVERQQGREWLISTGVAFAPDFDSAQASGLDRTSLFDGPVVADVDVTWHHAGPPVIDGDSHFAFLYDSTILRQDDFAVGDPGFTGPGPYDVTSYLDLDPTQFEQVSWIGAAAPSPVMPGVSWQGTADQLGYSCVERRSAVGQLVGAVVTTWRESSPALGPTLSVTANALRLGYDFARAVATVPGTSVFSVTQRYRYAVDDCDDHPFDDPESFQVPVPLQLDPSTSFQVDRGDLDMDGFDESMGYYYLSGDKSVEFRVEFGKPRLIVRVELYNDAVDGVTVWRDGVRLIEGQEYLAQPHPGDGLFQDPPGVIIAINDAEPGADYVIAGPGGEPGNNLP